MGGYDENVFLLFHRGCVAQGDFVSLEWGGLTTASVHRTDSRPGWTVLALPSSPPADQSLRTLLIQHSSSFVCVLQCFEGPVSPAVLNPIWVTYSNISSKGPNNQPMHEPPNCNMVLYKVSLHGIARSHFSMGLPGPWPLLPSSHPRKRDMENRQKWQMQISLHLCETWAAVSQVLKAEHHVVCELVQQELQCQNWNRAPSHRQLNKKETEGAIQLLSSALKQRHGNRHHPGVLEIFCPRVEGRGACHYPNSMGKAADNSPDLIFQNEHWDLYHTPPFANTMRQKRALHCRLSSDNNAISSTFWDTFCFSRF